MGYQSMRVIERRMWLLALYLSIGAVAPLPMVFLYVFFPRETVDYFNGQSSDGARFWCSVTAGGDAVLSFLCFKALLSKSKEVKILVVHAMAVFSIFHIGAFWYWSSHGVRHPEEIASGYPLAILVSLVAASWWGWLRPPAYGNNDNYNCRGCVAHNKACAEIIKFD